LETSAIPIRSFWTAVVSKPSGSDRICRTSRL